MKFLSAAICLLSIGFLSSCVDDRYNGAGYGSMGARGQTCGYGQNDVSHPYAGRCDWRRENGRDWADSGANNSIYRRR
ncbi:hypothetical protein [uncultured Agrobacterium sp.]|uniref:hypothetical protein n=1 Tax=uncultured Agrobacterium sp. TaxID=157277 RepID=UPI0025DB4DAD|nr:hypothetical protein [uncultured Agrobacterium sp.]